MPKNNSHFVDSFISYQEKQDNEVFSQIRNESNDNHLQQQHNISKPLIMMNDITYDNENSIFNDEFGQNMFNAYNNQSKSLKYNHVDESQAQNLALNQSQYDYGVDNKRLIHNQHHYNQMNLQNQNNQLHENELKYQEVKHNKFQLQQQPYEHKILPNSGWINTLNGATINNRHNNRNCLENSSNAGVESFFNESNIIKNETGDLLELSSNDDVNLFFIIYPILYI